jgi:hypothetical protein
MTALESKISMDKERMVQKSVNGVVNRLSASLSDLVGKYCFIFFRLYACISVVVCVFESQLTEVPWICYWDSLKNDTLERV